MNSFFLEPVDTAGVSVTHPDTVPRPRTPIGQQSFFVGRLSAEFSDFALGWSPTYPTRLVARPPVNPNRIGTSHAAIVYPTSFVTSWMPTYPTYRAAPRVHRVFPKFGFDPLSGADMRVAQQMAWNPRIRPIFLRPKVGRTQFAYVPPASVIVTGIGCAEMIDEQGAVPTLITQTQSSPTLIDQVESSPTLINEDFC